MTYDFGLCSSTHTLLTSKVTNAKSHQTSTVADCNTGLILRVTDPNNKSTYTQYDNLGRVVEVAGPGDTLTRINGLTRHPDAVMNTGTTLGNGGNGPTTWIEYLALGVINQQRTVTHTKDGTQDGRYVKTFLDGLGRTIQTRNEANPTSSGARQETVSTVTYDNLGRVFKQYVPRFETVSDSVTAAAGLAATTLYDALGRAKSVTPPGLSATTTQYTGSGTEWRTTVTDATDVLGRVVRVARQNLTSNCIGGWCTTLMQYDAAGRLIQVTDPANNNMTFTYDGLGRKKQMTDPDMGTWAYDYDDNGNLTYQKDAKGQVINLYYDPLNRIIRKDLPPAGQGSEDTTYFYDGEQPSQ
jgi:YD repeat-containing protein